MNFADIWHTSQEDYMYYILFYKRELSDFLLLEQYGVKILIYFYILGHTVYLSPFVMFYSER